MLIRLALALSMCCCLRAQNVPEKARIEGTVVNAITGQPVRKARLMLMGTQGGEPRTATSDAQGKYSIANIPPGVYRMSALHDGFLGQVYGAKEAGEERRGETIELSAGAVKSKVDWKLTPMGAILGYVRDEDGEPVRNVEIAVMAYGYGTKGKSLQIRSMGATDAKGEYRLYDLPPGQYYVRAKPIPMMGPAFTQQGETYKTVFFPNAPDVTLATAVELAPGQEARDTNFVFHPSTAASIKGRVIAPPGSEKCNVALEGDSNMSLEDDMMGGTVGFVLADTVSDTIPSPDDFAFPGMQKVDKDGRFEFKNVPAGSHVLRARCTIGKQKYSAKLTVQLGAAGLDGVELRPAPPSSMTAIVQIEGDTKSKVGEATVFLREKAFFLGADGAPGPPTRNPADDGTVSFKELEPDVYHFIVNPPKDLFVKSISQDGREVFESGVDLQAGGLSVRVRIILSANGGQIDGTVENGAHAMVALIPEDRARQGTDARSAVASEDGKFSFPAVPPGKYRLFAWDDVDINAALFDAEFRKPFEGSAQRVEVAEKQKVTAQLKLGQKK